jgi:hypothetical protein
MNTTHLPSNNLDFAWDRPETEDSLRAKLAGEPTAEWLRTAAWLMREANVSQVWTFLTLRQVSNNIQELSPFLGRKKALWNYLIQTAHELGRI